MAGEVTLPPAYRLITLDKVESTNDEAKRLAREGAEDGTLVWAREQGAGRGRGGRNWTSPRGNLYLSLVLRPECPASRAAELGFVAAVGLGTALASLVPPLCPVNYKWPNDVLLGERKVAGILIETESALQPQPGEPLEWMVLGLGVNVQHYPEDTEFPATSLRYEGAGDVTVEALLGAFALYFLDWANRWMEDGFTPIQAEWKERGLGIGRKIRVRLPRETLRGKFMDLDADGALLLQPEKESGIRRITAGDVFFE
jgi:BirA family transcriptional regulator, biotin operon repressor / biotin---[acetyl-CoA-carboxylase] ligase